TNNHVVEGARSIVVTVATTGETYRAEIVGTDPAEDVAVLQLEGAEDLPTVPIGDSDQLAVGDLVAAIGNAGGVGGTPSIAAGRVAALGQQITATAEDGSDAQTLDDMIQVTANVVPGDSGGPLADDRGTVVGMTTAASIGNGTGRLRAFGGTSAGVGYAIPIGRALEIVDQILAGGGSGSSSAAPGGYLGVQVTTSASGGVEIAAVMGGSPAATAGIEVGDTVVAVDDTRLSSPDELVDLLAEHDAGDDVVVTWFGTDGRAHQATVALAAR
ncbi:MAG TPA: trypsin-like peptidase domain-containing protein, partial [Acidimicrobiales bacterium]